MFIDTHCHLNFEQFSADRDEVITRARDAEIDYIINVGSDLESSRQSIDLSNEYEFIYAAVGVHPHDADKVNTEVVRQIKEMDQASRKVVAIGEVGLDYYRDLSQREVQQRVFRQFIDLACDLKLPLIIHNRQAHEDVLKILKEKYSAPHLKGVVHCFSADKALAQEFLKLGLHISFTANITFKKADALRAVVAAVPIEKILLETDAPFLSPQIHRGKRNEPAYVRYIAEEISRIKKLSVADVARITTLNARQLFSIGRIKEKAEIAYPIRNSLYLNITNRCTNKCNFCVRFFTDYVKGHNLKLEHEPSTEEILKAIGEPGQYKEIVFCGYGEPTLRLDVVLKVARALKGRGAYIRINTNGHGSLIQGRSIVNDLKGLIDEVSISLDVDTAEKYNRICRPQFGPGAFKKVKEFVTECKKSLPKVGITCIDLPEVDMARCRQIARDLGVNFRMRHYNEVG